jgi:hypothetical protein
MADYFLPAMLPAAYRGQQRVPRHQPGGDPDLAALKAAWCVLATLPDAASLQDWPLVPVQPRALVCLDTRSKVRRCLNRGFSISAQVPCADVCLLASALLAEHWSPLQVPLRALRCAVHLKQIVEEGSWAEGVTAALMKMGVAVLDSSVIPLDALGAARDSIHPAAASGVLTAIGNACGNDLGRVGRTMTTAEVSDEERRQLRAFLLQVCLPCWAHAPVLMSCWTL